MNKQKITILVLVVLLILALAYIVFDIYQQNLQEQQLIVFQQGAQYGYEQAVTQIMQQASTCQIVPLYMENTTINIVAIECLQTGNQTPGT